MKKNKLVHSLMLTSLVLPLATGAVQATASETDVETTPVEVVAETEVTPVIEDVVSNELPVVEEAPVIEEVPAIAEDEVVVENPIVIEDDVIIDAPVITDDVDTEQDDPIISTTPELPADSITTDDGTAADAEAPIEMQSVTLHYVDTNGDEIEASDHTEAQVGHEYDFSGQDPVIDGYVFSEIGSWGDAVTGVANNENPINIYFVYQEEDAEVELGAPAVLTIQHRDANGNEIAPDSIVDTNVDSEVNLNDTFVMGYYITGAETHMMTSEAETITVEYTLSRAAFYPISHGDTELTGQAPIGMTVTITLPNGEVISTIVGDNGRFHVSFGTPLKDGEIVTITVHNQNIENSATSTSNQGIVGGDSELGGSGEGDNGSGETPGEGDENGDGSDTGEKPGAGDTDKPGTGDKDKPSVDDKDKPSTDKDDVTNKPGTGGTGDNGTNGTNNPATINPIQTNNAGNGNAEATAVTTQLDENDQRVLPQAGEADSTLLTVVGAMLSTVVGFVISRRRA